MNKVKQGSTIRYFVIFLFAMVFSFSEIVFADEITDRQSIKIVQAALNVEGYDCGSPDGIPGKKTKAAVEKYQKKNNLEVNGKITDDLTISLGLSAEMLKGVVPSEFVERYNEAVDYCNKNSKQTGDPSIKHIKEKIFKESTATLDDSTSMAFLLDERKIAIRGIILSRQDNSYDIPMVYELISSAYAMDDSFNDFTTVIDFVGDFVENHAASSGRMDYAALNYEGAIYFAIMPNGK